MNEIKLFQITQLQHLDEYTFDEAACAKLTIISMRMVISQTFDKIRLSMCKLERMEPNEAAYAFFKRRNKMFFSMRFENLEPFLTTKKKKGSRPSEKQE